jgi:hypothetical protein
MRQSGLISDIINNIAEEERGAESTAKDDELMSPVQDAEEATVEEAIAEGNKAGEETVAESTEGDNIEGEPVELIEETGGQQPRRSARIAGGIKPPERYVYASFVDRSRWAEESAKDAIRAEVTQLFKDLKALEPVKIEAMVTGACVLTCHMFLVQKYFANGDLDKMKARLVSHGNQQDKEHFPDRSSPTVAIHSVMMVLALFAGRMQGISVCKIDVKGAFVQTPMKGEPIYLKIGRDIVKHILEVCPEYASYAAENGTMYVKMLKAMYGCVQASLLWYKLLVEVLSGIGFVVCEVDRCVMRLIVDGVVNLILIYVDDLLVFATKDIVDLILKTLTDKFTWLTVEQDQKQFSYLGMQLILSEQSIVIDMQYYLQQILNNISNLGRKAIPGGRETFQVTVDSESLNKEDAEWYHTITAKLLYLAKRARPDILTVVSFLCTRVTKPTVEDKKKLMHVLGYLHTTRSKVLTIAKRKGSRLEMYVDAAYGLHEKGESHSGTIVLFGGVVVYVSSKKQKCIAKSPTDAEVVALSDNIDLIDLFHEFAEFISNENVPIPMIYEDCKACIDLVKGAKGQIRTKQMRSRIFRVKEFLDENKGQITFVKTEQMWADGASKTLVQPKQFATFAKFVLGEETTSQPVGVAVSN